MTSIMTKINWSHETHTNVHLAEAQLVVEDHLRNGTSRPNITVRTELVKSTLHTTEMFVSSPPAECTRHIVRLVSP